MVQVKISDSLMCGFEGTRILTVADVLRFFCLIGNFIEIRSYIKKPFGQECTVMEMNYAKQKFFLYW